MEFGASADDDDTIEEEPNERDDGDAAPLQHRECQVRGRFVLGGQGSLSHSLSLFLQLQFRAYEKREF